MRDLPTLFGRRTPSATRTDVTGPMAALIARVDGEWRFDTADSGTRVTWQWSIHPRNAAARLAMPVFVRLWRGFARQSLPELGRQLS